MTRFRGCDVKDHDERPQTRPCQLAKKAILGGDHAGSMQSTAQPRSTQLKLFSMPNPLGERMGPEFFKSLPMAPGVYRFYGSDDRLLYIGQSNDLRARVSSYRHVVPERHPRRTLRMVGRIARIEWEVCATAEAAIARESLLLLELRPPFNRAGVWQGSPWWFQSSAADGHLVAQITRETAEGGIGPLPSPFRYAYAALMRWTFRLLHPERLLSEYPLGLLNDIIPPAVRWNVDEPARVSDWLRNWAKGDGMPFLEQVAGFEARRAVSPGEEEFWQEQLETITKFWKNKRGNLEKIEGPAAHAA